MGQLYLFMHTHHSNRTDVGPNGLRVYLSLFVWFIVYCIRRKNFQVFIHSYIQDAEGVCVSFRGFGEGSHVISRAEFFRSASNACRDGGPQVVGRRHSIQLERID